MRVVVFDMDGTLSSSKWREPLIGEGADKDWHRFHRQGSRDAVIHGVAEEARTAHDLGFGVVILTSRSEQYRTATVWWLMLNDVPFDEILMRGDKDFRKAPEIKADEIDRIIARGDTILFVYDDHPGVLAACRERGIPVRECTDPGHPPATPDA